MGLKLFRARFSFVATNQLIVYESTHINEMFVL